MKIFQIWTGSDITPYAGRCMASIAKYATDQDELILYTDVVHTKLVPDCYEIRNLSEIKEAVLQHLGGVNPFQHTAHFCDLIRYYLASTLRNAAYIDIDEYAISDWHHVFGLPSTQATLVIEYDDFVCSGVFRTGSHDSCFWDAVFNSCVDEITRHSNLDRVKWGFMMQVLNDEANKRKEMVECIDGTPFGPVGFNACVKGLERGALSTQAMNKLAQPGVVFYHQDAHPKQQNKYTDPNALAILDQIDAALEKWDAR